MSHLILHIYLCGGNKIAIILLAVLLSGWTVVVRAETDTLKVLQLNIWHEGTQVEGGFQAIVDEIIHAEVDVAFLSEVRNYEGVPFVPRLIEALRQKGVVYYGEYSPLDVGILSRYPILEQEDVRATDKGEGSGSLLRALLQVGNRKVAVYSTHLDYKNYACYLPRGYDGATWKKMDAPVTDADSVLQANRLAYREELIRLFVQKAKEDRERFAAVLLGGDFNEPSHLDWQEDTRHLWDHRGVVVNWDCSSLLQNAGYKDAYRVIYPNPVTHPGFTFPSDNNRVPVDKLAWAPEADERDRIDFIYYAGVAIQPLSAKVVGPSRSIVRGERVEEHTSDVFLTPLGVWPSDHKGVLVTFLLR